MAARDLPAQFGDPPPALTVRAVRLDSRLGLAALHYRRGAVAVYCDQNHMPVPGSEKAGTAIAITFEACGLLALAGAGRDPVQVTFRVHDHGFIPYALHDSPPLFLADGNATIRVCECLMTDELASALGCLSTGWVRYLAHATGAPPAGAVPPVRHLAHPA